MSCLSTILLGLGSRIAVVCWWYFDPKNIDKAFKNWGIPGTIGVPNWIWPVLGLIFIPCTTLAYLFLYPDGIVGYEWVVIIIALIIDLTGHGGSYHQRKRLFRKK